jgi:hypothetical protein
VLLFYQGYPIVCSLQDAYRTPLQRLANLYGLHDKQEEQAVIDYFYVRPDEDILNLSAELSEDANDEHLREVLEKEIYSKQSGEEEEGAAEEKTVSESFDLKKAIAELDTMCRQEESMNIKVKRATKALINGRLKKLATLVSVGRLVVAAAFHVVASDNTGEFDPYFIERMKHALQMMKTKEFAAAVEAEMAGERPSPQPRRVV